MITKRLLVTETVDSKGNIRTIYGRYDAVSLARKGECIKKSEFKYYMMSDADFVKHATEQKGRKYVCK